ncbi:hypothetical protein DFH08DRAFT_817538 [Mycena albidolilacea]|uniref:Uncharacterized protein n=1 Tax=Mycena albidolilacea TaxID=1033008 RepID=A0AAD6ZHR5_9AGAR|nr:hypothetical protein DFH08DRAFT_817538 [Mycena albidolilacea]
MYIHAVSIYLCRQQKAKTGTSGVGLVSTGDAEDLDTEVAVGVPANAEAKGNSGFEIRKEFLTPSAGPSPPITAAAQYTTGGGHDGQYSYPTEYTPLWLSQRKRTSEAWEGQVGSDPTRPTRHRGGAVTFCLDSAKAPNLTVHWRALQFTIFSLSFVPWIIPSNKLYHLLRIRYSPATPVLEMRRSSRRTSCSRGDNNPGFSRQDCSCITCHKSHHHTEPYVHSDACHLLVRLNCRRFGHPIPDESAHALLRFAPKSPDKPANAGPFSCPATGCSNQQSNPRQGSQKCIEYKCKTCCVTAAGSAARSGRYRDLCKTHGTLPVQGIPIAAPTVPAHPAQAVYGPPSPPPTQPSLSRSQGQHGGPSNLSQSNRMGRALGLINTKLITPVPITKGERPLQLQINVDSHQTRLLNHPALMNGLQIDQSSWFDLYVSTYFLLNKHTPTRIRLQPGLLVEFTLVDCPGINEFIGKQSRKRTGTALVSPSKAAQTGTSSTPGHHQEIIEIPDSPPPTFPPGIPLMPSSSRVPVLFQVQSQQATLPHHQSPLHITSTEKKFPDAFYACEHEAAWKAYNELRDSTPGKTSILSAFPTLFPGTKYSYTTVTLWRNTFINVPPHVKAHFVAFGRTDAGSWKAFLHGLREVEAGRPLVSINTNAALTPTPIASLPSAPPTKAVKAEPVPEQPLIPNLIARHANSPNPTPAPANPAILPEYGLCDFCDMPLTVAASAKLAQLLAQLIPLSHLAPTPANTNHRIASLHHQSAAYCRQHNLDAKLLPTARAKSWPEHINYAGLVLRVMDLSPTLRDILNDIHESEYFQTALDSEPKKSTAYSSSYNQLVLANSGTKQFLQLSVIYSQHPQSLSTMLRSDTVMDQVLDLDISPDLTSAVLKESTPFGLVYHSDTLDRDRCVQREKEHGKAREEPALPLSVPSPRPIPQQPSPFPVSSPLLPPQTFSPHLAPAAWSRSPTPPSLTLDSSAFCSYCDQELPFSPSSTLTAMEEKLSMARPSHGPTLSRTIPTTDLFLSSR